ncbi:MAG: hypothetical protein RLZZ387_685 [Chloroflexota bacterium]|jgi:hypothetical protein
MSRQQRRTERVRGRTPRYAGGRALRQRFLIVCEGEETETNYFRAFQVPGLVVRGVARQADRLIEEAVELARRSEYDQVWCVFDQDDCSGEQVQTAYNLARRHGYKIAFSNQAFELWYLLHFHYFNTSLTRRHYVDRLSQLLGRPYSKNTETIYAELISRQPEAIRNAARLSGIYNAQMPPHDCDPSTTVHLLVEELNKYRRPD